MRFSLKTFLLTITLFGTGCGLFVHFKNNNPEELYQFLRLMATIAPFVLALTTVLWVAAKGSPAKNLNLILWASLLIIVPIAIQIYLYLAIPASSGPYGMVASHSLVSPKFAGQLDSFQVWQELDRRVSRRQLSDEEVDTAFDSLIASMESASRRRNSSWVPGSQLSAPRRFLVSLEIQKRLPPKQIAWLLDLNFGSPTIENPVLTTETAGKYQASLNVRFTRSFVNSYSYEMQMLWTARFFVDGQPQLPIIKQFSDSDCHVLLPVEGQGEHELRVEIVRTYVPMNSGPNGFTSDSPETWNVSKNYPLKTIPVTVKVNVGE